MPSLTIYQEAESFDFRDYVGEICCAQLNGGPLFWNRNGLVGKVPAGILRDTLDLFIACEKMQRRGRIVDLPAAAYTISWDQTEDHRPESARPDKGQ